MSRDGAASDESCDLLAAYVDGAAELSPEERRQIAARLASDPRARADEAALRALLGRLRAAGSAERDEPDWTAMERSIRAAVGPDVPRPWWRRLAWIAPAGTLVAAAAGLLLWVGIGREAPPPVVPVAGAPAVAAPPPVQPGAAAASDVVVLWLDGAELDVDLSAAPVAGLLAGSALAELAVLSELDAAAPPGTGDEPVPELDELATDRLLPPTSLAWIDRLDDAALDRAERWLARTKG